MSEIKNPPIEMDSDGHVHYTFTESHTVADIVRFAISQSSFQEVEFILSQEYDNHE